MKVVPLPFLLSTVTALMAPDETIHDRKPHSRSLTCLFCREERFKDPVAQVVRDSRSGIANAQFYVMSGLHVVGNERITFMECGR